MRALLDPQDFRRVQEDALAVAEDALQEFESDVDILLSLIKKGKMAKSMIEKSGRLGILFDHFDDFVSAKERLEMLDS